MGDRATTRSMGSSKGAGNKHRDTASTKQELEQELTETIERYTLIAKATNDVIYDLNLRQNVVTWNDALYTQYGYRKDAVANTLEWWVDRIHPDDAFQVQEEINELLSNNEESWHSEYRFQKANKSYVYVRNRAFVQRDKNGMFVRIIGSMLDISQQKNLDRAKDEFMSLVSHQLRTPLTIIRMYSEMLTGGMAGELNARQQDYTEEIAHASVRMIKMVGDILNISRLELDRVRIDPTPTDLNALTQLYIEQALSFAREKNVSITFEPDPSLPFIPLDPPIFGQIIHNLLSNAIHYTKAGMGQIQVALKPHGDDFLFSVTDNGIGIPAKDRPHVFERFYRARNAVAFEGGGTGLGLYLVKLITETFKGEVWFDTRKNKGSTFYVLIPRKGMETRYSNSNGNYFMKAP